MQYNRDLKKKLFEGICLNGLSTLRTANEYNVPIKTLKKWVTAFNKDNHCFDPIIETVSDFRLINGSGNVNYEDLDSDELKTIIMKCDDKFKVDSTLLMNKFIYTQFKYNSTHSHLLLFTNKKRTLILSLKLSTKSRH